MSIKPLLLGSLFCMALPCRATNEARRRGRSRIAKKKTHTQKKRLGDRVGVIVTGGAALLSISCFLKEKGGSSDPLEEEVRPTDQAGREKASQGKTRGQVQIEIFNQAKAEAGRAYNKETEKLNCVKFGNVDPNRRKMSKQELRNRWLQAARELDFHALEWLQCDEKRGGSKGVTRFQEDGKSPGEEKGFHVLHYAALYEHLPIVKDIGNALRNYPEFHALDVKGRTAMDIAYEKQNIPILNALKGQGGRREKYKEDANLEKLYAAIKERKESLLKSYTKPLPPLS